MPGLCRNCKRLLGPGSTASLNRTCVARAGVRKDLDREPKNMFLSFTIHARLTFGCRPKPEKWLCSSLAPIVKYKLWGMMAISSCTNELKSWSVSMGGLKDTLIDPRMSSDVLR